LDTYNILGDLADPVVWKLKSMGLDASIPSHAHNIEHDVEALIGKSVTLLSGNGMYSSSSCEVYAPAEVKVDSGGPTPLTGTIVSGLDPKPTYELAVTLPIGASLTVIGQEKGGDKKGGLLLDASGVPK
jgi:hypothetical protein